MSTKTQPDGDTHEGPVVIGYDGGAGGADGLALGLRWSAQLGSDAVVVVVYPGPAPVSPARVDAEWVADRRAEAERLLDEARKVTAIPGAVFRAVGSGSASHGLQDVAEELGASLIVLGSAQEPQRRHFAATRVTGSSQARLARWPFRQAAGAIARRRSLAALVWLLCRHQMGVRLCGWRRSSRAVLAHVCTPSRS